MNRTNYSPEFKAKIVLELLREEKELNTLAAENNINPNQLRNWKAEFVKKPAAYLTKASGKKK